MNAQRLNASFFWTSMVGLFVLAIVTLGLGITWIDRPFPGFLVMDNNSVNSLSSARWTGCQHGIKQLDVIREVDGRPVANGHALYEVARQRPVGSILHLRVDRPGEHGFSPVQLEIPTQRFSVLDFLSFFLIFWIVGLFHVLIGLAVSLVKPGDPAARAHLLFCGAFGVWYLTNFECVSTLIFTHPQNASFALLAAVTLNLAFLIPRAIPALVRHPWLRLLNWGLGLAFSAYIVLSFAWPTLWPTAFDALMAVDTLAILAIPISAVWARFSRTSSPLVKSQAAIILWGALFAYLPSVTFNGLATAGITVAGGEFTYFALILFPAAIAYTIVRHRLFGIDVIIKRTVTYALVTAALAGGYFLITAGIRSLFGTGSELTNVVGTGVVAVAFAPVRDRIKGLVDRLFFRTGYDLARLLTDFGDRARETFDAAELLRIFVKTAEDALFPLYAVVYLHDADRLRLAESLGLEPGQRPQLELTDPVLQRLLASASGINPLPTDVGPFREATVLPLRLKDELVGVVLVGPRKSDQPYVSADRTLLLNLGQQLALWVKNAQLFGQLAGQERMKRELEIAHEVQSGLLPSVLPQLAGIELAATSIPALEVGGDFYDVIPLDDHRLGILIGDVSGKGVPAALLMAMTVVIFRSISRECPSPSEVMARANELIFLNRPSRKVFVTAFYAVYDSTDRSLTFTNAGNPLPIGTTGRLEAKGISLGMFPVTSYEEQRAVLHPGEMVLMYSDGAEDALGAEQEQFGEERLVRIVSEHSDDRPLEVQQHILESLRRFADGKAQFDDITLVTLKATA